ncbi:MAG: hypothetical protein KC457_17865 [Myxococcales bacterium]|nr:hypothetical protein [Myxococcales bacterium]
MVARSKLAVAVALVGVLGAVLAWVLVREPDEVVRRISIAEPSQHWQREGFVEMVPPIRLPTATPGEDDVVVWLRIPEGGVISTRPRSDDGAGLILSFPPGTVADRVESRGRGSRRGVIDVRGTRLGEGSEAGEEWMHTLRRDGGAQGGLFGYEWPRSSGEAHGEATRRLLAELAEIPPGSTMDEPARVAYLSRIESKNQCVVCHVHERSDNRREGELGVVDRGTDGNGFFTPHTVLLDEMPLERYGDIDPNLHDPWVEVRCPEGEVTLETRGRRLQATCPNDAVPRARFNLALALSHGDARAKRICIARRYLYEHLDERGREHFAAAIDACAG